MNDCAEKPPAISLFSSLPDDVLDKCFSFVGEGHFRFIGGTCRRFRDVYVKEATEEEKENGVQDRTTDTYWRHVCERVPCAQLCLQDQERLGRTPRQKKRVMKKIVSKAIKLGKVEILAWAHKNGFICSKRHFQSVGKSGHVNVLEWAQSNNLNWHSITLVRAAVENGSISVMDFVWNNHRCAFDSFRSHPHWPYWIAESGHIPVLEWFEDKNLLPDSDEDISTSMMIGAVWYGHVHVLNWLCEHGYEACEEVVDEAASEGHINVLQWAQDKGIHGTSFSCIMAADYGRLHALQWLRQNDCPWDSSRVIACAEENGHDHIVEWVRESVAAQNPFLIA